MKYNSREADVIIADSFKELNYKQKKLFLASLSESNADRDKFAEALIKITDSGVYIKLKEKFCDLEYRERVLADLEKRGVECVTIKSADYPAQLKNIPVPPLALYLRGNRKLLGGELFGVVGSRKTLATVTGQCSKICSALAEKFVIVTGVADGADSAAAEGALPSGKVICVLPGGHDSSCAANVRILREVEAKGLTVSEFPPLTPAQRYTFLLRNRILAGLCSGVLVVSAAKKSGALSTASYAADYSKEVFAFPYGIGVPSGEGCNTLIKNGAYLCDGEQDIFEVFGIECKVKEEITLSDEEQSAVNLLREQGELHAAAIASALGKKLFEATAILSSLEIKGIVIRTGGNTFSII